MADDREDVEQANAMARAFTAKTGRKPVLTAAQFAFFAHKGCDMSLFQEAQPLPGKTATYFIERRWQF